MSCQEGRHLLWRLAPGVLVELRLYQWNFGQLPRDVDLTRGRVFATPPVRTNRRHASRQPLAQTEQGGVQVLLQLRETILQTGELELRPHQVLLPGSAHC